MEEASKSIIETIKDKAYHIISKFEQTINDKDKPFAEFPLFREVMSFYSKNDDEIA